MSLDILKVCLTREKNSLYSFLDPISKMQLDVDVSLLKVKITFKKNKIFKPKFFGSAPFCGVGRVSGNKTFIPSCLTLRQYIMGGNSVVHRLIETAVYVTLIKFR